MTTPTDFIPRQCPGIMNFGLSLTYHVLQKCKPWMEIGWLRETGEDGEEMARGDEFPVDVLEGARDSESGYEPLNPDRTDEMTLLMRVRRGRVGSGLDLSDPWFAGGAG